MNIGAVDSYTAPSDGWICLKLTGLNITAQGIIECVGSDSIVGQSLYGETGEWGAVSGILPVKAGNKYRYVIESGSFASFYFFPAN